MYLTGSEIEFLKKQCSCNELKGQGSRETKLWIEPAMEIDPITQFLPLSVEEQDWLYEEAGSPVK